MMPFFSVVTEVNNRSKTIERTLNSIANQTFENYEYIIIESGSSDNSLEIIKKTLNKINKSNFRLIEYKNISNEMERWNLPLKYAIGKYVVVIEGDDWFDKKYLEKAYEKIIIHEPGVYVGKSTKIDWNINGLIKNKEVKKKFRVLDIVPAPSEAIFIREHKNKPYLYDDKNYVHAAEISLYEKIINDGYNFYFENDIDNNIVNRGISLKRKNSIIKVIDHVYFCEKNKESLTKEEYLYLNRKIGRIAGTILALQIYQLKFELKLAKLFFCNLILYSNYRAFKTFLGYMLYICPKKLLIKK